MPATFTILFLILMAVGVPIAFALALAPIVGFMLADKWTFLNIVPQRLVGGINQFPLLAIPLFILSGEVMNAGGVTSRLVAVARAFVGHFRAGLAQVNIATSMLFAGLSGSAVADTSALGSMMIPAMEKEGYSRKFAAAVTAASSIIGPIIPPSIMMVIYAFVMHVSVGGLRISMNGKRSAIPAGAGRTSCRTSSDRSAGNAERTSFTAARDRFGCPASGTAAKSATHSSRPGNPWD